MRVGFLTSDWSTGFLDGDGNPTLGGAGWYRVGMPAAALKANGFDVVVGSFPMMKPTDELGLLDWEGDVHGDLDIVVAQRWMHHTAPEVFRRARSVGQIVINDVDDWFGGLRPSNMAFEKTHVRGGMGLNRAQARRAGVGDVTALNTNHYMKALAASSGLIVSTPYLRDRLHRQVSQVPIFVVRNAIDLARWAPRERSGGVHPVLGWVGGTSHRSGDLETLRGVLGPFVERHDLRFHHSGHLDGQPVAADLVGVAASRSSKRGMSSIFEYPRMFDSMDVSLVPLSDTPFNHSKSAVKGMESIAAGVPFVASATPEYRWLHETHGIGRIAKRPNHWASHLAALLDPQVRVDEWAEQHAALATFDIENRWSDWLQVFLNLLAAPVSL